MMVTAFLLWCPREPALSWPCTFITQRWHSNNPGSLTANRSEWFWELLFTMQSICFSIWKQWRCMTSPQSLLPLMHSQKRNREINVALTVSVLSNQIVEGKERNRTGKKLHLTLRLEFNIERYILSAHITMRSEWLLVNPLILFIFI